MIPAQSQRALFDKGLQPERTALAWRRTALALAVASLGATRVLPGLLGAWAVIPASLGVALSVWVLVLAHRRHVRAHRILIGAGTDRVALHGGALPATVAGLTLAIGCTALIIAVVA